MEIVEYKTHGTMILEKNGNLTCKKRNKVKIKEWKIKKKCGIKVEMKFRFPRNPRKQIIGWLRRTKRKIGWRWRKKEFVSSKSMRIYNH